MRKDKCSVVATCIAIELTEHVFEVTLGACIGYCRECLLSSWLRSMILGRGSVQVGTWCTCCINIFRRIFIILSPLDPVPEQPLQEAAAVVDPVRPPLALPQMESRYTSKTLATKQTELPKIDQYALKCPSPLVVAM